MFTDTGDIFQKTGELTPGAKMEGIVPTKDDGSKKPKRLF